MDFSKQIYNVSGMTDFKLTEALQLWKAKYPEFIDFEKDVISHPALKEFGEFVQEMWDSITAVTVQDALSQENSERRRVYFDCIGVQKIFTELEPKLLDRQVIKKNRMSWSEENVPAPNIFEDVYELYQIDGDKMFTQDRWGRDPNPVFAVRCWCTTTNREYWLYVPMEAALGVSWLGGTKNINPDAIRAIAWTIRIDVRNPEMIYRQGDIIVVKVPENVDVCSERHITKDEYLNLMYSES
jgi:hypothetical protein